LIPNLGLVTPKQNIGDDTANNVCDADYPCVRNGQKGATTCGGEHVVGPPEVCNSGDVCVDNGWSEGGACCAPGVPNCH
jgi:hypothetical protein